ncbi:MAG TPA: host specificity factor TipJ family phage tail protein [Rhizomicrobium sp.]
MGRLIHIANPLAPGLGASITSALEGETILDAIRRADLHLASSTVLLRDANLLPDGGDLSAFLVPRREWGTCVIDGDAVLVSLPMGGGGAGASNGLQIVAQIALLIVSTYLAGPLGTFLSTTLDIGLQTAQGLATVLLLTAGRYLISAVLPAPGQKTQPTASPTYSLNAQSNQARLGQPIPEMLGEFNIVCDEAAAPYFDYQDNNQQLYMLFVVGRGSYAISQLRIGSNVIAQADDSGVVQSTGAYPEITWEIIPPGGTVTLFPDNVDTSTEVSSIELLGINEDSYDWTAWFVCNPPRTFTNKIAIDIALPAGLSHSDSDGNMHDAEVAFQVQAQKIDDDGVPVADPVTILTVTIDLSTVTPQRSSYYAQVDAGRWQVRAERTNRKATSSSTQDTLVWVSLRAFLPPVGTYGDLTLIAVQASATKNLNAISSQQFNVTATRTLPAWDAEMSTWLTPAPTRSIAWATAYFARKQFSDANIDLDWLAKYDAIWTTRGDTFDGIFDTPTTFWDGLTALLNVGRAQPVMAGGKLTFVRDEPKSIYRCGFSPRNMVPSSFGRTHIFFSKSEVDALLVSYVDSRDWKPHNVLCALPGSTATVDTATPYNMLGVNNYAQAWREGITKVASSRYRRILPNFDTELEGRVCFRGDLVWVAHWSASWGASADALAIEQSDAGDIITLSEPWTLNMDPDGARVIVIAAPDGQVSDVVPISLIDDGETTLRARVQLLASAAPAAGLYATIEPRNWGIWGDAGDDAAGLQLERPRVTMGQGTQRPQDAIVVSMTPAVGGKSTLNLVIEDPRVHQADNGDPPPEPDPPQDPVSENLTITGLDIRETWIGIGALGEVQVTVTVSGAPDGVTFDYQTKWNGAHDWTSVTADNGRIFQFQSHKGTVQLQVRAVDSLSHPGNWFERDFYADGATDIIYPTMDFSVKQNAINLSLLAAAWS